MYGRSLEYYAALMPGRRVASVFLGGGTPSLMEPATVAFILERVAALWPIEAGIEVTLEANPTSVENQKLKDFKAAGVNRVSLGVQSLRDADLKFLGRTHDRAQALAAIEMAGALFDRFSFDLIYARPGQSLQDWQAELSEALRIQRGHLSLYQLTIERSTPFYLDQAQGKFTMPDDGLAADFYALTQDITAAGGLPAYEVSNHAQPGHESAHNLIYWNYGDYIGIGPGAHGRITRQGEKFATREHAAPGIWLERVQDQGAGHHPFESVPRAERFAEALMMGLRLPGGVPVARLEAEGQCSFDEQIDLAKMEIAIAQGWMAYDQANLILTREGMLRLNALLPFLLK
jgi:oxygen-independent coproporphyrinogen-3 oxidase